MPDRWIRIKDRPLDTGLYAGGAFDILETGMHPTKDRKIQPVVRVRDVKGDTLTKIHFKDCKDIIGFYRRRNPVNSALHAILEIEEMNIAHCEMTSHNEFKCHIKE
jgi:hypothetical protein